VTNHKCGAKTNLTYDMDTIDIICDLPLGHDGKHSSTEYSKGGRECTIRWRQNRRRKA
jgi:hypothetical protein